MKSIFKSLTVGALALGVGASAWSAFTVDQIASMQLREDGQYSVLCKDHSFEVVTSADILKDNVCPFVPAPVITLEDGSYADSNQYLCDQKATATYSAGVLTAIRLDFPGCTGDFLEAQCEGAICLGTSYGQEVKVTITDATHYKWENLTYAGSNGDYSKVGPLNLPVVTKARSQNAIAVGTR